MNESFVYIWRDRLPKKYYIGYHNGSNPNYICSSKYMMEQYNQRPQDFKRRILKYGPWKEMGKLEKRLLKSRYKHFGFRYYNLELSFPIYKRTEESLRKLSEALKDRKLSEETKRKMSIAKKNQVPWNKGKKHSEEAIRKMSVAHERKPFTEEHKRNMSIAKLNQSEETKRKISETLKDRKKSEETCRRMSIAHKGRPSPMKGKKIRSY